MPVRYEMTPEEFEARMSHRREIRKLRRSGRRRVNALVVGFGLLVAGYVIVAVVWGVR